MYANKNNHIFLYASIVIVAPNYKHGRLSIRFLLSPSVYRHAARLAFHLLNYFDNCRLQDSKTGFENKKTLSLTF